VQTEFNRAANASPRSGSTKKTTPIVLGVIVLAIVVVTIWFTLHA
jgi:hypothetical protein